MQRYGKSSGTVYGIIDNLTIAYNGNQLKYANDAATDLLYNGAFNFVNGSNSTEDEYIFDKNGNIQQDYNKKISKVQYNQLNLPSTLQCTNGNRADYLYSADGIKQRTTYKTAIANISVPMGQIKELTSSQVSQTYTTDYCGNVIYENGNLSKILTEEDFVTVSGTTPTYHYYLKDHQGNNRVVLHQNGTTVEQVNHYYPFGGLFGEGTATSNQAYKYNGKELDRMHGLDWYDYGARMSDAVLGRFMSIDPSAESYYNNSLYAYCGNNPITRIDPDGRDWYKYIDKNGEWKCEWRDDVHNQEDVERINSEAKYFGLTYRADGMYYSLFGQILSLNTKEGKATEKLDQAIIEHVDYLKRSQSDFESKEQMTDFDIGEYAKTSALGLTENIYFNFEYGTTNATGTAYYYLIGKGYSNKGTFEGWTAANTYLYNSNRGAGSMKAGYNLRFVRSGGSNKNWNARIVFTSESVKEQLYNVFRNLFYYESK